MNELFRPNDWNFGVKIGLSLILIAVLPVAITSAILSSTAANSLLDLAFNELEALTSSREESLTIWLGDQRADVLTMARNPFVADSPDQFHDALEALVESGDHDEALLSMRQIYLAQPEVTNAGDGSAYSEAHATYHPFFADYVSTHNYDDFHIVSADGDVLYTVTKGDDFGTNLEEGAFAETGLARAFETVKKAQDTDLVYFEDFSTFAGTNEPAAFLSAGIYDENDQFAGAVIVEVSEQVLTGILDDRTGLGETGETYVVGEDLLFRNESRFLDQLGVESTILNPEIVVDTAATQDALAGGSGIQIIEDYRGVSVLSAWSPFVVQEAVPEADVPSTTWAFMAEIDEAEVRTPVRNLTTVTIASVLVAVLSALALAYVLTNLLTRQVDEIQRMFSAVGVGNFDARADVYSQDELGQIAEGVNAMIEQLNNLLRQSNEERRQLQNAVQSLVSDVAGLAAGDLSVRVRTDDETTGAIGEALNFAIHELNQIVYGVEEAASRMTDAQDTMSTTVNLMVQQAGTSAELAEQAASTATAGDEAVGETIATMERIRDNTQETARRIKRLGEVSQEISSAVRLIEEIADRTTVLALNASIQAAAAGEAGRGFAVVAEEVQRLAERATNATRDIENMVKSIQAETGEAVYAIEEATREVVEGSSRAQQAGTRMNELNELVDSLASLVQHVANTTSGQINDSLDNLNHVSSDLNASVQTLSAGQPASESSEALAYGD